MTDQKNLILAIALSLAILLGFQFLFPTAKPTTPSGQQQTTAPAATTSTASPQAPTTVGGAAQAPMDRAQALAQSQRVKIEAPRVHGSINLTGGRIDDVTLRDYRETVDPNSPEIVLLTPLGGPSAYYADYGWAPADTSVVVPGASTVWTADRETLTADAPVTLTWDNGQGLVFKRTISIDANYMFTVVQSVVNNTDKPVQLAPYGRVLRFGTPVTQGYYVLHEGPYGVFNGTLEEKTYKDIQDDKAVKNTTTGGWLGFTDKYWLAALIPDQSVKVDTQFLHQSDGEGRYLATYQADAVTVAPGQTMESTGRLFAGAKEVDLISSYADTLHITKFDFAIDFGWFWFLTKPFFKILAWIHSVVGNFGVAILIFTLALKLLFYPLADKSYRSMAKMKALQPEMVKLRERFADDKAKQQQELMALYKREKVNPAAGCLPIIIQIPVFFALYKVLLVTIEMRHAPFFGWMHDLSAPDPTTVFNLFGLIPWSPPAMLMIGAAPIIMGFTMFLQQKLNPAPADPVQAKVFMLLPIVFTFMLAHFPVGLVVYWAWNNTLTILQQWSIMKRMHVKISGGVEEGAESPVALPPSVTRKKSGDGASKPPTTPKTGATRKPAGRKG
ncbi:membrane protein insertase YidC [Mycobacterium sp. KBS0706]|uniref:membrane protein insertase YidC n=1 Tax=Mycobacterium sp. KBS0706 TaxID=2578109 RepID=UPI00110FEB33|nr:membrane protein insertase YidC [Mycobacterium sp. KBS0706]TSD88224.1 membrane protein insertase YidC [Mycobacterium sp. KBS0706]